MPLTLAAPSRIAAEINRQRSLELRLKGLSYAAIGERLGLSKTRAWEAVQEGLKSAREETAEKAADLRDLELRRLDAYAAALSDRVGDPRVVDTLLRISEQRAKLLGLNAPTPIAIGGLAGQPIGVNHTAGWDLSKLTTDQLLQLEAIQRAAVPVLAPESGDAHVG